MAKNNYRVFYTDYHVLQHTDVYAPDKRSAEKKAMPAIERAIGFRQMRFDIKDKLSINAVSASRLPGIWWNEYIDSSDRASDIVYSCRSLGPHMGRITNPTVIKISKQKWVNVPSEVKKRLIIMHPNYRVD